MCIVISAYLIVFFSLWIYFGASKKWDLSDGDVIVGAVFMSLFWPIVAVCIVIYGFFSGLIWIGKQLPKAYAAVLVAYYRWKYKGAN